MVKSKLDGCKLILILDDKLKSQKIHGKIVAFIEAEKRAILNIDTSELEKDEIELNRPLRLNILNDEKGVLTYKGRAGYYLKGRLHVERLEFIELVQRRKDVKVNVNYTENIEVTIKDTETLGLAEKVEIPVTFRDISAGGACFCITGKNEFIEIGDTIRTWFTLGREPIRLKMEILREVDEGNDVYSYGCRFIDMVRDNESIIREFVFKTQLGMRKNAEAEREAAREAAQREIEELKEKMKEFEHRTKKEAD